jgi:hypothetical protein
LSLPEQPLPNLSEIERMQASIYDGPPRGLVVLDVSRSHWQAIYSAMQPAHRDEHPAKWVGPGDLKLKLKGGEYFSIALYYVDADAGSGAFSAGQPLRNAFITVATTAPNWKTPWRAY